MYSFRPKPDPDEREALKMVLDRLLGDGQAVPDAYRSEWRRAALEEGVGAADDEEASA